MGVKWGWRSSLCLLACLGHSLCLPPTLPHLLLPGIPLPPLPPLLAPPFPVSSGQDSPLPALWDTGEETLAPGSNPTPASTGCAALDEVLNFSEPQKKNKMEFKISTSLAASKDHTKKALKCRRL